MTALSLWVRSMELGHACGCHQLPARSFCVKGYQFPLCARCTGVALGQLAGLLPPCRTIRAKTALLLIAPLAADATTQLLGLQTSTNRRRLATGILAGIGGAALLRCGWNALRNGRKTGISADL